MTVTVLAVTELDVCNEVLDGGDVKEVVDPTIEDGVLSICDGEVFEKDEEDGRSSETVEVLVVDVVKDIVTEPVAMPSRELLAAISLAPSGSVEVRLAPLYPLHHFPGLLDEPDDVFDVTGVAVKLAEFEVKGVAFPEFAVKMACV